jgi:hypothetical protein
MAALDATNPDISQLAANTVWLHTKGDTNSLLSVRAALKRGPLQLTSLLDRRALIESMSHEPLYVELLGVLLLGTTMALLLALIGNMMGSWLRVRTNQMNFVLLRALGASSQQITTILGWEQCLIYLVAIVLGIGLGLIFSLWAVPILIFTGVGPQGFSGDLFREQLYASQSVPPIQIIMPASLGLVLMGCVLLCFLSLLIMLRASKVASLSQKLRLNED